MSWIDVIREHDRQPVVKLHCFTCRADKYIENARHEMSDSELDTMARKQGWVIGDGGVNGKCPTCIAHEEAEFAEAERQIQNGGF